MIQFRWLKKRLNRLIATMALAVILFGGGLANVTYAENAKAHEQFVFAYRLLQRGDDELAMEAFDEYISKFPKEDKRGDAFYYRALLAKRNNNNKQAIQYLEKSPATKLVPTYAMLLLTGQVYCDLKQYEKSIQSLEKINVTMLKPSIRASVFFLRGQAYRGLKNFPAAAEQMKLVIKYDSQLKTKAMLDLARIQAILEHPDQAIQTLKDCLALGDIQVMADAARLAGDLAYQQKKYEQAIGFYRNVTTQFTSSKHLSPSIVGILWSQLQLKQYGQVLETFEQYKKYLDDQHRVTAWYLAASSLQESDQHAKAISLFGSILAAAAGSPLEDKVLFRLASSQFEVGQYDGMIQTIAKLRRAYPKSKRLADAAFLLASASLRQGDFNTAAARLTTIVDAGQAHPYYTQALLQRAKLFESLAQNQSAAQDYQTYIQTYGTIKGQILLEKKTVFQALLRMVELNYHLGKFAVADQAAAQLIAEPSLDPLLLAEALYRRSLTQVKLKQFSQAYDSLNTLLEKLPANHYRAQAFYYRGLLAMSLKKQKQAISDLQEAVDAQSLSSALTSNALRLIAIGLRNKKEDAKAATTLLELEKIVGLNGLAAGELYWMAQYQLHEKQPSKTIKYLTPITTSKVHATENRRAQALMLAGKAFRELADYEQAVQAYQEVVSLGQGLGVHARLELARTFAQKGSLSKAIDEFAGLISARETAVAAAALYDAAQVHLQLATERLRASDTLNEASERKQARNYLKRLVLLYPFVEISPLPELSFIKLAKMEADSGDTKAAKSELNELIEKFPDGTYAVWAKAKLAILNHQTNIARSLLLVLRGQTLNPQLDKLVRETLKGLEGVQ